ncbi:LysR substrate-binding domain-containing protein [Aquamicrobium sp. LC103]|uniref:LysR substrate-binding domain-containing protein n=1 Tax=Aquamicrobium sp. LC103 TaxID=1120658 RepID=UPI00063EC474|nr:LysR substrate-binding domain-containing protein [Aquamicrobium sp. LC103]
MIRLSHFEAFNAVMRSGSMTAAATLLHTSQPNISRAISRLESETGLKLFDRLPGKLQPTSDGLALFEEVRRSFVGLRQLTEAAHRIHRSGSGILRLGSVQSHSLAVIPRAVKLFSDTFPEVTISIHAAHSDVLSRWVQEHICDFALVSTTPPGDAVEREELYNIDAVCILPPNHPLVRKAVITPADLQGQPLITVPRGEQIREMFDKVLQDAGVDVNDVVQTPYSSIACALVAQGIGLAVVNPFVAMPYLQGDVVARPFLPAPTHSAILIYPKGKPKGRPVKNFVAILRQLIREDHMTIKGRVQV